MTVIDLLKMHPLKDSYIIAGLGGQHRTVKRIDFLENPFPDVKMYMELDEFIFTTFFNMKDDRENRIALIRYMIKHGSAGIAILPDLNLNGVIDPEILDLGNRYDFPIVYIPSNVRYSDIIEGYGLITGRQVQEDSADDMYFEAMKEISALHQTKNIGAFCDSISEKLRLPLVVIRSDTVYAAHSDSKITTLILSKAGEVSDNRQAGVRIPVSVYVTKEIVAVFSFYEKTAVATYLDHFQLQDSNIRIFRQIAPILAKEVHLAQPELEKPGGSPLRDITLAADSENRIVVIRKKEIGRFLPYLEKHFTVYYENERSQYVIIVVGKSDAVGKSVYTVLRDLEDRIGPQLLIFSHPLTDFADFEKQIRLLQYVLPDLLFLQGIFSADELPILYIILFSPYDFKEILNSVLERDFAEQVKPAFFDTLRLYLLINNISDVSDLLGIHSNSVKYQIHKCFADPVCNLSELPALRLLTKLELMKVEGFGEFRS